MYDEKQTQVDVGDLIKTNTQQISELYGKGVNSIFEIGRLLSETKTATIIYGSKFYDDMVETLPFEKGQADKYVSIFSCGWAKGLVDDGKVTTFPSTFTTLYQLTTKKLSDNPTVANFLSDRFSIGSFLVATYPNDATKDDEVVPSSQVTFKQFQQAFKLHLDTISLHSNPVQDGLARNTVEKLVGVAEPKKEEDTKSKEDQPQEKVDPIVLSISIPTDDYEFDYPSFLALRKAIENLSKSSSLKGATVTLMTDTINEIDKWSLTQTSTKDYLDKNDIK